VPHAARESQHHMRHRARRPASGMIRLTWMTTRRGVASRMYHGAVRRRRWILALAAALAGWFALVHVARLALERVLSAAVDAPVSIGALRIVPWAGRIALAGIEIGRREQLLTVDRLSIDVALARSSRQRVVIDRVEVDHPVGAIALDTPSRVGGSTYRGGAVGFPSVAIDALAIRDAAVAVHRADATMRLTGADVVASDLALDPAPEGLRFRGTGRLTGTLAGAPVAAAVQLDLGGPETQITADVTVTALAIAAIAPVLPAALASARGTLDAHCTVGAAGAPLAVEVAGDVAASDAHLAVEGQELAAKRVALHGLHVDVARRRLDLGSITVQTPAATLAVDRLPAGAATSDDRTGAEARWAVASDAIDVREGAIRLRRGDASLDVAVVALHLDAWRGGTPSHLTASAHAGDGGRLTLEGTVAAGPLAADVQVRFDRVPLPPIAAVLALLPVGVTRGEIGGDLHVVYDGDRRRVTGSVRAHDLHTAPPDAALPSEVMAVGDAEIDLAVDGVPEPTVEIASARLAYPYVMVQRRRGGTFPYLLLADENAGAEAADRAEARPVRVRVHHVEASGGKVEFVDATVAPPYWTSLTDVSAAADDVRPQAGTVAHFKLTGKQDELSPITISGAVTERGLQARAEITDVLLESTNTYVAPLLGYRITAGRLSLTAVTTPAPPLLESSATLVVRGIDVSQTGVDIIRAQSGVPLPIALGLIADMSGAIRLTLPFTVDPASRGVSLGSVVWQAVRSAVVGALTSPLRALGSLFGTRGAPHAFAIDPIPFAAGSAALDAAGMARVEQIARILDAHPTLALVLMPQIAGADIDAVGAGQASALAADRLTAVHTALTAADTRLQLDPARLLPVAWTPAIGAKTIGRPGMYVELQEAPR
jgi:hypothetical protein